MAEVPSVYEFGDCKTFLTAFMAAQPNRGRGERAKLSRRLNCDSAYVTQVLSGRAKFSLEQAQLVADYAKLNETDSHFLLLLVQRERAGTVRLKRYFSRQIENSRQARSDLSQRLVYEKTLPLAQQAIYYSAWYYPAVHMLLRIPQCRSAISIQRYLGLPATTVKQVIDFLVGAGLAREANGMFETTDQTVHLAANALLASRSHANWRDRATAALENPTPHNFHFSSVASMSFEDAAQIQEILIKAIERIRRTINTAPDSELFCYAMDLFTLRRS